MGCVIECAAGTSGHLERTASKTAAIPLGGLEGGGYRLVCTDTANMFTAPWTLDGGVRFPHLERTPGGEDVLKAIGAPRVK